MTNFDFISQKDFRISLEADYKEMRAALAGESWKSVQILAGSIVETLLIDYIVSTSYPGRVTKDPLKMDLGEAIEICKDEKILSSRAADLCAVVKSYRNLIHPGRMVRLSEQPPDRDSATVASTLVHMIASELGAVRVREVGMTAEQLLAKILKDGNAISILKHLLTEAKESELPKLLELISEAHRDNDPEYDGADGILKRLEVAFEMAFNAAKPEMRRVMARQFVQMLKEADSTHVDWYIAAFLTSAVFEAVEDQSKGFVKDYLFGRIGSVRNTENLHIFKGLGRWLTKEDAQRWVDPFVRLLLIKHVKNDVKRRVINAFAFTTMDTSKDFDAAVQKRLEVWLNNPSVAEDEERKAAVEELISAVDIPF